MSVVNTKISMIRNSVKDVLDQNKIQIVLFATKTTRTTNSYLAPHFFVLFFAGLCYLYLRPINPRNPDLSISSKFRFVKPRKPLRSISSKLRFISSAGTLNSPPHQLSISANSNGALVELHSWNR